MNTVLALLVLLVITGPVLWLVERNHRRVGGADRSPYGVGLEAGYGTAERSGADRDADRVWVDLISVRARQSATLLPRLPRLPRAAEATRPTHRHHDRHAA